MRIHVIHLKKSYYWTFAAMLVVGLFWFTGILQYAEIPVSGLAPYYHGDSSLAQMSLTINVDWGEVEIPKILEILRQKNVKATFFITGYWANKFPDLVKQIYQEGHEVANHGYSHAHPNQLSRQDLIDHIKKNEEILFQITGERNQLYAPPYGEYNKNVVQIADELGYKVIMWSADTIDWQNPPPDLIIKRVMRKASNGGIVLMHPKPQTVAALPQMVEQLHTAGYKLVTVSELLGLKSGEKDDN